ncbi:MAG: MGMT family protein [Patescibacteria group bacterium]
MFALIKFVHSFAFVSFNSRVYKAVSRIPKGKVTTYGFISALIGSPRAARQVGWALRNTPEGVHIPWWRVINSNGYISIRNPEVTKDLQKELLEKEGVKVSEKYVIKLRIFQWQLG